MKDVSDRIRVLVEAARREGRTALLETESNEILASLGFKFPSSVFVRDADELETVDLGTIKGDRAVVKVIAHEILHKTDVDGVAVVKNDSLTIRRTIKDMHVRLSGRLSETSITGFTVHQFIEYEHSLGGELLLGFRWTEDFGPVIVLGFGGVQAEVLARHFKPGREIALYSPLVPPTDGVGTALIKAAVTQIATWELRGRAPIVRLEQIVDACNKLATLAKKYAPELLTDVEINPLVISNSDLYALDSLAMLGNGIPPSHLDRPVDKIKALLEPRSIAIVGASEKRENPGRAILNNTIREGYSKENIYLVKRGCDSIAGCRCFPHIDSLPGTVDLIVLAVAASQLPEAISEIIDGQKAQSIIVIPGGLEEKPGASGAMNKLKEAVARSRNTTWRGPVINGGNSLGIQSVPGRYDTMFIPQYKIGGRGAKEPKVALLSQSGAFTVAQRSKLLSVGMRYTISIGNQMDLTIGDYLDYLERDDAIDVVAVYVEGFKPLDGVRFLEAAQKFSASGRTVILYSGGRTEAGAHAAASHTASVAGNYAITRELALGVGVVVAEKLDDFVDTVMLFDSLRDKPITGPVRGLRLGALSNAGFECVALADNLGGFRFEPFTTETTNAIERVLEKAGVHNIVDARNPLDVTPMINDEDFEAIVRAVMKDDIVDVGVVGCSPFTPALNTLLPGDGHHEDFRSHNSIVQRLIRLWSEIDKPWVVVVDGGPLYDDVRRVFHDHGIPTFGTADRALRLFSTYCESRLRRPPAA